MSLYLYNPLQACMTCTCCFSSQLRSVPGIYEVRAEKELRLYTITYLIEINPTLRF